ncbi:MAG: zinc carboxypeptidase, partial [Flavobacteriales bacterium]|nr:zinc carboxypeptidase [Flavobacteriales bacterium]
IIDPCVNPDGRDRYVQFQDRTSGPVPNTSWESWEHKEPWPGGRSNHYMFDLNRDLAWQTQIETQARTTFYRQWMPHVHVDYHEQGMNSPYYFAPAAEPLHQVITPWQRKCQEHIGGFNAQAFDARGALYFTREIFDLFYPSYGDTWPMFHGAIGMTYEQGGSGSAGRAIQTEIGDTLTLAYRIENHHATAIATISAAIHHKDKLLKEFSAYHRRNREEPWGDFAAYLIPAEGNDKGKMVWLTDLLDKHGITYTTPKKTRKSIPALDYSTLKPTTVKPSQGDILIDSHQPHSALLGVLFDPDPVLSDSLTYDITTWALPFAYGLKCFGLTATLPSGDPFEYAAENKAKNIESPYAWVIDYKTDEGTTLLAQLLKNGVVVRVADSPFTSEGIEFDRGTLLITKRNNEALLDDIVSMLEVGEREIAGLRVTEVRSGLSEVGPDLGSEHFHFLKAPRVAIVSGESVSSLSFGEVWHRFEQIYQYPVTITEGINRINLDNYDVVVMPRGWYSLNENQMNEMSSWVNGGGQLIAIGGACRTFADKDGWGLSRKGDDMDEAMREDEYDAHSKSDRFAPFALDTRMSIMDDIPGAVYDIGLDNTHPLAYGYENHYLSIKTSTQRYAPLNNGGNVGVLSGSAEPFSGFSGSRAN